MVSLVRSVFNIAKTTRYHSNFQNQLRTMVIAKKYVFQKHFVGYPKPSDLELLTEELPPIKDGEFLTEAVYLSVDPYMRAYAPNLKTGTTFIGSQVAKIVESKHSKYPVGKYVVGEFGWRTHTISKGEPARKGFPAPWIIPDFGELPMSLALGALGMPGNTAYFGFLQICKPNKGETVAVSGAAGAVGSLVGQIAKIQGCTVIGIAGSDEKGKWLVEELGFDSFVNYKDSDFRAKLRQASPNGIDCYFDNVGGPVTRAVLSNMNEFGRISVCGAISGYNDEVTEKGPGIEIFLVMKQLKMEGFIVHRWSNRWTEGILQMQTWIKEGKIHYRETVTEGFDNMFSAFVDMLKGGNFGKAIVKV